jgi:hypothetical protein
MKMDANRMNDRLIDDFVNHRGCFDGSLDYLPDRSQQLSAAKYHQDAIEQLGRSLIAADNRDDDAVAGHLVEKIRWHREKLQKTLKGIIA